jgi:hypothetical protein
VTYVASVIVLNRRAVIRIQSVSPRGRFLVGYFTSVEAINDHGRAIDLADVEVEGLERSPGRRRRGSGVAVRAGGTFLSTRT